MCAHNELWVGFAFFREVAFANYLQLIAPVARPYTTPCNEAAPTPDHRQAALIDTAFKCLVYRRPQDCIDPPGYINLNAAGTAL